MKYLDYPEQQKHGSLDFPYYFYRVTPIHPRYTMPYHWHPLFEIVHVFQGQFHLQLDNCLLELNAGDTALIQGGLTTAELLHPMRTVSMNVSLLIWKRSFPIPPGSMSRP